MEKLNSRLNLIAKQLSLPEFYLNSEVKKTFNIDLVGVDANLISSDNLDVLLNFLSSDTPRFDFCYIDPPYNTGQKFIYSDSFSGSSTNLWGAHSAWLSFMLPRLFLAREVLSEEGIIAVSIDDYEFHRLKVLLDSIFGEQCCLATIIVNRSKNGKGSMTGVAANHEYVLIYGKSSKSCLLGLPELRIDAYDKVDEHGAYKIDGLFRKKGDASRRQDRPNMYFPLYYSDQGVVSTVQSVECNKEVFPVDSVGVERRWLWGPTKAAEESWKLYASKSGVIYVKNYLTVNKRVKIRSIWDDVGYLTERATKEVKEIFGEKVFETPKPLMLIEHLIQCCSKPNSLVLDFFAGTGTTAHAVHNLNVKEGASRKVILVEQAMPISDKHPAALLGFNLLSDLTEARLKFIQNSNKSFKFKALG